jgi:hypothetical protein
MITVAAAEEWWTAAVLYLYFYSTKIYNMHATRERKVTTRMQICNEIMECT